jgi:hypothetical protein
MQEEVEAWAERKEGYYSSPPFFVYERSCNFLALEVVRKGKRMIKDRHWLAGAGML